MSALNNVILFLSDKNNIDEVPYQDSKLTRILCPIFEGNTKVVLICNISPLQNDYSKTLTSLLLAKRVTKIKQVIIQNEADEKKLDIVKMAKKRTEAKQRITEIESVLSTETSENEQKILIEEILELDIEISQIDTMILVSESLNIPHKSRLSMLEVPGTLERRILRYSITRNSVDFRDDNFLLNLIRAQRNPSQSRESIEKKDSLSEQWLQKTLPPKGGLIEKKDSLNELSFISERQSIDIGKIHMMKESIAQEYNARDSILLEKIENIAQLFESFNPRQSILFEDSNLIRESFSFLNTSDIPREESNPAMQRVLILIDEQDKIIDSLQQRLMDKDDQIEILQDELTLCRNNLANMQKQLKEMRKKKGNN